MYEQHRIIVYDGHCVLCNRWLSFLPPRDSERRYHFCPRETQTGRCLMRAHALDPDNPRSFLYLEQGTAFYGSDAVIRILSGLGGRWRMAQILRILPRVLRDAAYYTVARNRYRWYGRAASCIIPSQDLKERFLEWPLDQCQHNRPSQLAL